MDVRAWPLVGRAEELDLAVRCLTPPGRGIVIAGDPGVGKSRLADEVLRRAESRGQRVVRLVATSAMKRIAFGVFAPLVRAGPPPDSGGLDALRRVREALLEPSGGLVVAVDDAHDLDDHSVALLSQMTTAGEAILVATYRTNESISTSLVGLWKDGHVERLELQPLTEPDAAELVRVVVGPVDDLTLRELWTRSDGNPLYLRELLAAIAAADGFVDRGGAWTLATLPAPTAVLTELVETRLVALGSEHRAALEVLVVAESLGLAHAQRLGMLEVFTDLEESALVRVDKDGRRELLRISHPIYGEVLRTRIGTLRRRVITGTLADGQAAIGTRRGDDVLRLAQWQLDSGGTRDPDVLLAAARHAWTRVDPVSRERMARAAVEAGAGPDAAFELSDALWWLGRVQESLEAAELVDVPGPTPLLRARARSQHATCLFLGLGDFAAADSLLRASEAEFAHDSDARGVSLGQLAQLLTFHGELHEAIHLATTILDDATTSEDARIRAYSGLIAALACCGRFEEADLAASTALLSAAARVTQAPTAAGGVLVGQCTRWFLDGRTADLDAVLHAMPAPVVPGADPLHGIWLFLLGRSALAAGRCADAIAALRAAALTFEHADPGRLLPWCDAALAQALAQIGDAPGAATAAKDARVAAFESIQIYDVELRLGEAWAAMAAGESTRARRLALDAAAREESKRHFGAARLAYQEAARMGAGQPAALGLARCGREIAGEYGEAITNFAVGLVERDAERLTNAADVFATASAWLLAAEAVAAAACIYASESVPSGAARCASLATAWRTRCGAVTTPLLATLEGVDTAALSDRELEVAQLARTGLPNREIADRLFISVRTVGNHLNHVYTKLGVNSRDELRDYFERSG